MRIFSWPEDLPAPLRGAADRLARRIPGSELVTLRSLGDLSSRLRTRTPVAGDTALLFPEAGVASTGLTLGDIVSVLNVVLATGDLNVVNVISDSFLGVEREAGSEESVAMSASIVALSRSAAVTRGRESRVNTICVPGRLFGHHEAQRGPLRQQVELEDVVEGAHFLADPENSYLHGQTLFVDGGRHIFSSLSA